MPQQTSDQNKQVAQTFVEECWNRGNMNKVSELLTDQVRFHDPVFPNLNPGTQNIAEHNEVVHHWTAQGTHKGPFLGIQPTNRKVTINGTSIYRLERSKIVEGYANWNLASMMAQLGVVSLPKEAMSEAYKEAGSRS